jgi:hypothetical protein
VGTGLPQLDAIRNGVELALRIRDAATGCCVYLRRRRMQKTCGGAAEQLSEKRPELFRYPPLDEMFLGNSPRPITQPLAGENFYVTPEIMEEHSQAGRHSCLSESHIL